MMTSWTAESVDLLLFDVGRERFALPLRNVLYVLEASDLSALSPRMAITGRPVIRWRDQLLPCHEPSVVLRSHRTAPDPYGLVLGDDTTQASVALLVDHAEAARDVSFRDMRALGARAAADRVAVGAVFLAARWVTVLDAAALSEALRATPNALAATRPFARATP